LKGMSRDDESVIFWTVAMVDKLRDGRPGAISRPPTRHETPSSLFLSAGPGRRLKAPAGRTRASDLSDPRVQPCGPQHRPCFASLRASHMRRRCRLAARRRASGSARRARASRALRVQRCTGCWPTRLAGRSRRDAPERERRTQKMPLSTRRSFYSPNAARIVQQHRLDGGPYTIAEFVAHDSRLRFRSLNRPSSSAINPPRAFSIASLML